MTTVDRDAIVPDDAAPSDATVSSAQNAHVERLRFLRQDASQWHRRGMRSPEELDEMVARRLAEHPVADDESLPDPSYGDFFTEPTD